MADGNVRGTDNGLKPGRNLSRRRGADVAVKPRPTVRPGTDAPIVDRGLDEARWAIVRDGGEAGSLLQSGREVPRRRYRASVRNADQSDGEARFHGVRSGGGAGAPVHPGVGLPATASHASVASADQRASESRKLDVRDGSGTGLNVEPASTVSPAADTIADQGKPEPHPSRVRDGGGGTDSGLKPTHWMSPAADPASIAGAGRLVSEARLLPVRDGDGGTGSALKPVRPVSPAAAPEIADQDTRETQVVSVRDGDGGTTHPVEPAANLSPVADTIAALVQLQRQRVFCIRTQSRADRSADAFIARECLGYHAGLPPAERKALMARAMRIRLAGETPLKEAAKRGRTAGENHKLVAPGNGRDHALREAHGWTVPSVDPAGADDDDVAGDHPWREGRGFPADFPVVGFPGDGRDHTSFETRSLAVPPVAAPIITMSFYARTAADSLRRQAEREMERLTATLPVAGWQASVKGFGRLGLAIVVAEAGRDLSAYPSVAKLWKRLGLAVFDGERQRRKTDPDLAALHGYVPRRRAEMWTLSDSMFRHQWRSGGEDEGGTPAGPYGEVYAKRRARTAETHPEWTKAHCRDDARRVMFKALVADLWGAWHGRARLAKGSAPAQAGVERPDEGRP